MSSSTPIRRILFALIPPAMVLGIISCAAMESSVQVPAVRGMSLSLRPVRVLVGVATSASPLSISAAGDVTVYSGEDRRTLGVYRFSEAGVSVSRGAVTLGGRSWGVPAVILAPEKDRSVMVGDRRYPGYIALAKRGEAVWAINYVEMEEYVGGVVSCEMPRRFSWPALEAQAVAARTYALSEMGRKRLQLFDLYEDERSQVYGGLSKTYSFGREAARRTSGVVIVYDWKFLPAFYFSTCGGRTAPHSQLAGAPRIKPFTGVECGYCEASKLYKWVKTIPVGDVEKVLAQGDYIVGRLEDVEVASTVEGGWVEAVWVISTGGRRRISGNAFRRLIGTSEFFSTNFQIRRSADEFVIIGRGYGHGVGMCQWGADGLGRRGRNFVEILKHYYPGAELVKIY